MKSAIPNALDRLPIKDRLELANYLLASSGHTADALRVTPAQHAELDLRLKSVLDGSARTFTLDEFDRRIAAVKGSRPRVKRAV